MLDKNIIHNEMMIHIAMNTHKNPQNVLVVGLKDSHFKEEISKYEAKVTYSDELNIDEKFDIIIYNNKDLSAMALASIQRSLEQKDGIMVCVSERFKVNSEKLITDLKNIGKDFWICMPFRYGHTMAILASKKYHPQADIILDRSDFIDAQYYNSEIFSNIF